MPRSGEPIYLTRWWTSEERARHKERMLPIMETWTPSGLSSSAAVMPDSDAGRHGVSVTPESGVRHGH